jgi:ubiquinone/menaquinone biosynthesis C-methylase UbiE
VRAQVRHVGAGHGIDAAPEMIEVACRKAARNGMDVAFQVGLIENIPFPAGQFDVALCSFMIFHMPAEARRKGITEIYRTLKPGGSC